MTSSEEFSNFKMLILAELKSHSEFIYLMGSIGTERFTENSDIDIAVYWSQNYDFDQLIKLKMNLENQTHRDVELISLNKIDPIYARQVIETGRLLFLNENKKGELLQWRMQKFSEYPDFKYSRKIIEDQILKRKKYV